MSTQRTRVLFTGYAPVHFLCFRPLHERLVASSEFDVFVSGGLRSESDGRLLHDARALYDPFGVPAEHVLTVEQIQEHDFDVLFAANTNLIEPRSAGTRVQIFHGVSFRNKSVRDENMGCDHYFLIGPYMHRKFVEGGLLAADDPRAVKIGFMKTDPLRQPYDRVKLLRRLRLDGRRPILLYAPTGQKHNSLETMGEAVIRHLAATGRYDVLVKLHDHPKDKAVDWVTRLAPFEDEHTRIARDADIVPLMLLADLLISDASSVTSEFALLDRPMVFLDVPLLLQKATRSGALDTDTWGRRAGTIVRSPERIMETVSLALSDPAAQSSVRRDMAADLFYNPGCATDAAMEWLLAHARGGSLVPVAGAASATASTSLPELADAPVTAASPL